MGELLNDELTNNTRLQRTLIEFVDTILAGPLTREYRGATRLANLTGDTYDRRMYGGVIVAAVDHAYQHPEALLTPKIHPKIERDAWRNSLAIFDNNLGPYRDASGRLPEDTAEQIKLIRPGKDGRIDIGRTVLQGLSRVDHPAKYVVQEAVFALRLEYGLEKEAAAAAAA